jgi:hypothetical protein
MHFRFGGQTSEGQGAVDIEHANGLGQRSVGEGLDPLGEDVFGCGSGHDWVVVRVVRLRERV